MVTTIYFRKISRVYKKDNLMKKNLKVIQLIDSLDTGGAEVLAVNIYNILPEYNIKSFICVTRKEGGLKDKINDNYIFLNKKKTVDFKAVFSLRKFIKKNEINIIHAHSTSFFIAFCVKILLPNIKIVWHDHYGKSEYLQKRKIQPLKFISSWFNYVISVNSNLEKWAKENLHTKQVEFVNNFSKIEDFNEPCTFLKGQEGKKIVNLAGFRPQKDHLNLLKAFKIVIDECPNWSLHLIGKSYKDDYYKSIINFIKENKMNNHVFIYGERSDIKNILMQSSIGVLSSKSEGLPLSLLEYGLAKLPVVVTNVGECKELIKNNDTGVLVQSENDYQLGNGILELIKHKKERNNFGDNLYKLVSSKYSSEVFFKRIIVIYQNL